MFLFMSSIFFCFSIVCSVGKCLRDKSSQGDCTNSLSMWHMRHSTQCIAMRLWTMFVLQTLWPRSRSNVCLHLAPWTLHQPSFFMLTKCFNTIFTQLLILSSDVMKIIWNWFFSHRYLTNMAKLTWYVREPWKPFWGLYQKIPISIGGFPYHFG